MASLSLRIRAAVLVALCSLLLFTFCIDVHGDDSSLKSLYDGHRWFELRDFIEKEGASAFYQGAVACVFNDLRRCDKKLRAVFNSAPRSDESRRSTQDSGFCLFYARKIHEGVGPGGCHPCA